MGKAVGTKLEENAVLAAAPLLATYGRDPFFSGAVSSFEAHEERIARRRRPPTSRPELGDP